MRLLFTAFFMMFATAFVAVGCTGETTTDNTDACAEVTCEAGQSCLEGSCVDDNQPEDETATGGGEDSDTTPDDTTDDDDDNIAEPEGAPCETQEDCEEGLICEADECVAPRGDECSPEIPCLEGLDCIQLASGAVCLEPCTETGSCRAMERCWADGEGGVLGAIDGHCFFNLCGAPDPVGLLQVAEWMGPCDANGAGDGICFGPQSQTQLGPIGICMSAAGELAPGSTCDDTAVQGELGGLCGDGLCVQERCVGFCDLSDPACEDWPGEIPTECTSAVSTDVESNAGVCAPDIESTEEDAPDESPDDAGDDGSDG